MAASPRWEVRQGKLSRDEAPESFEVPGYSSHHGEVEDFTIGFESGSLDQDPAEHFVGLPNDRCQCPRWGNVLKGKVQLLFGEADDPLGALRSARSAGTWPSSDGSSRCPTLSRATNQRSPCHRTPSSRSERSRPAPGSRRSCIGTTLGDPDALASAEMVAAHIDNPELERRLGSASSIRA